MLADMTIRQTYLDAALTVVNTLEHPAPARSWALPSALERMSIGDLAAHLARSIHLVQSYADQPEPTSPTPITAEEYFGGVPGLGDPDSTVNEGVRRRSQNDASPGPHEVASRARRSWQSVSAWLPAEPARRLTVFGGAAITLEEYLRTRLVEFAVHHDDLTVSLAPLLGPDDPPLPALDDEVRAMAIEVLVGVARWRHGDLAVLRGLARRERDAGEVLRVL